MNDILNKSTVLVLNRYWQAIHVKTPALATAILCRPPLSVKKIKVFLLIR